MKSVQILFLLVFTATILTGCGGAEERKAAYMEKAQQSMEAGDLDKARIELKNVLQIDPKYAEGFYKLGEIFEKQQEFRKAFGNYSKASELDPENAKYHAKIGQFYLVLANDIDKAQEKVQQIFEKDTDNIHGLLLKAGILLKQDRLEDAMELSKSIQLRDSGNVQNSILLSSLHNANKDYKEAIEVLKNALEENKGNMVLMSALANIYFNNKKYDKAEELFKKKISIKPGQYNNYVNLAKFYNLTDRADDAVTVLKDAIREDPDDTQRKLTLINNIKEARGLQDAIDSANELITQYPDTGLLRIKLAQLYAENNDMPSLKNTLKSAIKDFPEDETGISARVGLADAYINDKEIDKAKAVISDAADIAPNDTNVNMVIGKLAFIENNAEEAIVSLRKVVKDKPSNLQAYFMLSRAHASLGEKEQADDVLVRAYENNRNNAENLLQLAKYYIANRDRDQSEKIIDDYLSLNKSNYEALSIKASILNDKKKFEDAKNISQLIVEKFPDLPNGYIQYAKAAVGQNDTKRAEEILITGFAQATDKSYILEMLTNLQSALKKHDEAINRLNQKLAEEQSSVLYAMKGKAQLAAGKLEQGEQSLLKASEYEDAPPQVYLLLSRLYASQKNQGKLAEILQKGVGRYPSNIDIAVTLASLYERKGDFDEAIQLYEGLIDAGTGAGNAVVINNLAALLSDHRSDTDSYKRALELVTPLQNIDQPMLQDTVGWVYFRNDQLDKAIEALNKAVANSPDNPIFNYHLGMAFYESGDTESAKKHLNTAVNSEQDFQGKEQAREVLQKI